MTRDEWQDLLFGLAQQANKDGEHVIEQSLIALSLTLEGRPVPWATPAKTRVYH